MAVMSGELLRDHPYKTHTLKCRHTLATYVWEMQYKRSAVNVGCTYSIHSYLILIWD